MSTPAKLKLNFSQEQFNGMPLEQRQRLFHEFSFNSRSGSEATQEQKQKYAVYLEMLRASPGFVELEMWDCTAKKDCAVEGVQVRAGQTMQLNVNQYLALSRFFTLSPNHAERLSELADREAANRDASAGKFDAYWKTVGN